MNQITLQLQESITEGNRILRSIPRKMVFDQTIASISDKYQGKLSDKEKLQKETQLRIVREEFGSKSNEASKLFTTWMQQLRELISLLGSEDLLHQLSMSQQRLGLDARIRAALLVVEKAIAASKASGDELVAQAAAPKPSIDWKAMIEQGESEEVEFKASLKRDLETGKNNKYLEVAVAKAIAAFLNTNGGTLFIGVADEGTIVGIQEEYHLFLKKNADGFILFLVQLINTRLGKEFNKFVNARVEHVDGKEVCIVSIGASDGPVFLKDNNSEDFYIRASASSQKMNVREALDYITMHWPYGK